MGARLSALRARLSGTFTRLDVEVARLARLSLGSIAGLTLSAITLGSGTWMLRHRSLLTKLAKNKIPETSQHHILFYVAIAAAALLLLIVGANVIARIRRGHWSWLNTTARWQRGLAFTWSLPLIAVLFTPKIESTRPGTTLLYIALASGAFWLSLQSWFQNRKAPDPDPCSGGGLGFHLKRWLPVLLMTAVGVAYAYWFSRLAITNHHAFGTRTIDLGYYDNIFYHSSHGRPLGCTLIKGGNHVSAHFDPILVLLSPLYLLAQRAETILIIQSVWTALGVIPAYLIGSRILNSRPAGLVMAIAYAAHPALHGANLYEFHSLTLLAMPLLWALYFLQIGALRRYYFSLFVLLLVREDVALLTCFVGLSAILDNRRGMVRAGWITILVSLVYFGLVKSFIMTSGELLNSGKGSYSFAYYFRDLIPNRHGTRGLLTSILSNPAYVVQHVLAEKKLIYLFTLLTPLVFMPLLAKRSRVILIYGAAFTLLATRKAVFSTHFQYSMVLVPAMLAITPAAIKRISNSQLIRSAGLSAAPTRGALLGCILVSSLLTSWKFGGALPNSSFRGGFHRVVRSLNAEQTKRYDELKPLLAKVHPGASVTITNRTGPHLTNRKNVYFYRHRKTTHYYFIDERELKGKNKKLHQQRLKRGVLILEGAYKKVKLYRLNQAKVDEEKAAKKKATEKKKKRVSARRAQSRSQRAPRPKASASAASSARPATPARAHRRSPTSPAGSATARPE